MPHSQPAASSFLCFLLPPLPSLILSLPRASPLATCTGQKAGTSRETQQEEVDTEVPSMEPGPDAAGGGGASAPAEAGPSSSSSAAAAASSSRQAEQEAPQQQGAGGGGAGRQEGPAQAQPLAQQPPAPAAGLSRYESQKRRDWNTFLQYLRNHKPPLTLARCSGAHVIEFLRYLDQFGKTKVHAEGCAYYGQPNPPAPCACPLRQAWGSLDALIGRLRAAYEESGGRPESNPFAARAVRIYLREVREAQAKARGIPYEKKRKRGAGAAAAPVAPPPVVTAGTSGGGGDDDEDDEPSAEPQQAAPISSAPPSSTTTGAGASASTATASVSSTSAMAAAVATTTTTTASKESESSAPSS